jgi:cell division protein FtsZ
MEASHILIAGVGGIGCSWAKGAHARCEDFADICLVDADDASFENNASAHLLRLGHALDSVGCAALPPLAEQRMRGLSALARTVLEPVELVLLLVGLGGGTGTGAAHEFARQARQSGAIVVAVAALPFDVQETRASIAEEGLKRLERNAHVTVRLSLERLARQARERGTAWQMGAEWVEDLIEGLVRTLMRMGLINLDLTDLRAIVEKDGEATLLVGIGKPDDPEGILESAMMAPLAELDVGGAQGCLIQVEGGVGMTIGQLDEVANMFTEALDPNAQVILGARVSEDLEDTIRVVTLLSGIQTES